MKNLFHFVLILWCGASSTYAATVPPAPNLAAFIPKASAGLHWLDWLVIGAYMSLVLGVGWYYSRQQTDQKEYFIAAKRHMHPLFLGISLFATLMSTITYLGKPGEVMNKGPFILVGQFIASPIAFFIVGWWVIPRLMKTRVTSAYELLEKQLGVAVRILGAVMFIGLRIIWMSMLIYLSSLALVIMLGLPSNSTYAVTVVASLTAIAYSTLGGIRSVVVTDVMQFSLLFLGALITILVITYHIGGVSWFPTGWSPTWNKQTWFSTDLTVRVTVFNVVVALIVYRVATSASDQTAVQRYMTTEDVKAARRSYLTTEIAMLAVTVLLGLLGFALLGFFTQFPAALAEGMTIKADADLLYPLFIANYLPVGIAGLVVSGALAAAMSSVDSGVNSITAVVTQDILPRLKIPPRGDKAEVKMARQLAIVIGVSIVGFSFLMKYVPGNFLEMTNRSANLVIQPIFALFVLALWIPFSTPLGALLGCAYGLTTATLVGFWSNFTDQPNISYHWIGPLTLLINLLVAIPVSKWGPRRADQRGSTRVGMIGLIILGGLTTMLITAAR